DQAWDAGRRRPGLRRRGRQLRVGSLAGRRVPVRQAVQPAAGGRARQPGALGTRDAREVEPTPGGHPRTEVSGRGTESVLVTGAFSYSGSRIAELLIESGRSVRTLTHHPEREHHRQGRVRAFPYRFDDPLALARSLEGVTTLYNTYWVRFER